MLYISCIHCLALFRVEFSGPGQAEWRRYSLHSRAAVPQAKGLCPGCQRGWRERFEDSEKSFLQLQVGQAWSNGRNRPDNEVAALLRAGASDGFWFREGEAVRSAEGGKSSGRICTI